MPNERKFLRVHGAFDNVCVDILLSKLANIGCSLNVLKIKFSTHERFVFSTLSEDTNRVVCKGVPQDGVLSPLLYIIYVANITDSVTSFVAVSQFANDITVFHEFESTSSGINVIENTIQVIKSHLPDLWV